jgi:hypothetical protein
LVMLATFWPIPLSPFRTLNRFDWRKLPRTICASDMYTLPRI